MKNGHLSDERIQEFLDGDKEDSGIRGHLHACALCRGKMNRYQALYSELAKDPGFSLPADFADRVLAAIPAQREHRLSFPAIRAALILLGILLAAAAVYLFVDLKPLLAVAVRQFQPLAAAFAILWQALKSLLGWLNGSLPLLVFSGLALLSTALLDRLLGRRLLKPGR